MNPLRVNLLRAAALLGLLCVTGCVAPIPYTPDSSVLERMGRVEAAAEFRGLLTTRTRSPEIYEVEFLQDGFIYRYAGAVHMGWGAYAGEGTVRVLFPRLARVDIYENSKLFMVDAGGQRLGHELLFTSVDDCKRFADLLFSYKAAPERRADQGAAEQLAPPPPQGGAPAGGAGAPPPPNRGGAPR